MKTKTIDILWVNDDNSLSVLDTIYEQEGLLRSLKGDKDIEELSKKAKSIEDVPNVIYGSFIKFSKITERDLDIKKYGTSAGAVRAWDSRGRGTKAPPKQEPKPSTESKPTTERVRNEQIKVPPMENTRDVIQQDIGCSKEEAHQMMDSILYYTGDDYTAIRATQSRQIQDEKSSKMGNSIEEYIDKAPKYTKEIYRGCFKGGPEDEFTIPEFKVGDEIDMKGTSSWSNIEEIGKEFGSIVFVSSNTPKATAIAHLSYRPKESEVLVSKDTKFKVEKIERRNARTFVYVKGGL